VNELRRWSEEGATPTELSLLEVSRREHAPAQARARALGALGIAVAVSTVTATTAAATGRSVGVLLKVLGVSLVGGGLVAGGIAVHRAHQATATATVSQPRTVSSTSATVTTPVASESQEAVPSAASAAAEETTSAAPLAASSVSSRPTRPEAAAGRLSREVAALELAHQALAAHNPSSALHLLDHYRAEFPNGALGSEATVLRVQALLAGGNRAAAQTLADSYSSAHPDSPYARRIQDTLHSGR
jgi:hypothetical protein